MDKDISFDRDDFKFEKVPERSRSYSISKFLIDRGLVKNQIYANHIMLSITMLFLSISLYIIIFYVLEINIFNQQSIITPEQIQDNREKMKQIRIKNIENFNKNEVQD